MIHQALSCFVPLLASDHVVTLSYLIPITVQGKHSPGGGWVILALVAQNLRCLHLIAEMVQVEHPWSSASQGFHQQEPSGRYR